MPSSSVLSTRPRCVGARTLASLGVVSVIVTVGYYLLAFPPEVTLKFRPRGPATVHTPAPQSSSLPGLPMEFREGNLSCAPTALETEKLLRTDRPAAAPFNFFMVQVGGFDQVENCYRDHLGDLDDHFLPNEAEHLSDIPALEALRAHPDRTDDVTKASLAVIDVPFFASERYPNAAKMFSCERLSTDHWRRMAVVFRGLRKFVKQNPTLELLGFLSWWSFAGILGNQLASFMNDQKVMIATSDRGFPQHTNRAILIPYQIHYTLEPTNLGNHQSLQQPRDVSVMFHGNMHRRAEGAARIKLASLSSYLPNTSIEDFSFQKKAKAKELDVLNLQIQSSSKIIYRSSFCLVPAGDTATSRRLFDAIAAGCVPIVLVEPFRIIPNLPFRSSIQWSQIALFVGSLKCNTDNLDQLAAWLQTLLAAHPDVFDNIRKLGRDTVRDVLSFRSHGFANALLKEVGISMRKQADR